MAPRKISLPFSFLLEIRRKGIIYQRAKGEQRIGSRTLLEFHHCEQLVQKPPAPPYRSANINDTVTEENTLASFPDMPEPLEIQETHELPIPWGQG